jgi:hypothetical protein
MRKKKVIPKLSEAMAAGAKKTKPLGGWMRKTANSTTVTNACALGAALVEVDEPYLKKKLADDHYEASGNLELPFKSRLARFWPFLSKPNPEVAQAIRPGFGAHHNYYETTPLHDVIISANDLDGAKRETVSETLAKHGL